MRTPSKRGGPGSSPGTGIAYVQHMLASLELWHVIVAILVFGGALAAYCA